MGYSGLYAALSLTRDATDEEIKMAFRRLAMQYHPDRNPGSEEAERRFKEIAAAYDILSDPVRRRTYDLESGREFSPGFDYAGAGRGRMCGRGRGCRGGKGARRWQRNFASEWFVEITPEEARLGVEKEFVIPGDAGLTMVSVAIPPGAEDGAVFRLSGSTGAFPSEEVFLHVKIV